MATSENPPDPPFFKGGVKTITTAFLTIFHTLGYAKSLNLKDAENVSAEETVIPRNETGIQQTQFGDWVASELYPDCYYFDGIRMSGCISPLGTGCL